MMDDRYGRKYMIGPRGVEVYEGIIAPDMTRVEYQHIRGVNMKRSVFERILWIGNIYISTSGFDEPLKLSSIKDPVGYVAVLKSRLILAKEK